ncbi:MAG: sensor histidine kinase [Acidimicrobiales bacterium]
MTAHRRRAELAAAIRRAAHPPIREVRFWLIQIMVVVIASLHLLMDLHPSVEIGLFPSGLPIALLIIPVGYAALRYGLSGSAATGMWATLLWLPDLLLPHDQGHPGGDLVNLALIDIVAFVIGQRIESERLAHLQAERATAQRLAVEANYRRLFETNGAPILVLDGHQVVRDANPAARAVLGGDVLGRSSEQIFGRDVVGVKSDALLAERSSRVLSLPDGRDYRVDLVSLPDQSDGASTQVILEDVTEERAEGRRATRYAALVIQTEEDQRRRLARELHDEPLQLFLHLARRLEGIGQRRGVPANVSDELAEARHQALDAAGRLRSLAKELRPPALDQLGLVGALSSLLADVEDEADLTTELVVHGSKARVPPEVELGAFRILQEAVRNTLRHADASLCQIIVTFAAEELTCQVVDDGRGFPTDKIDEFAPGHFGLVGIAERAHLLGGKLAVDSTPGCGTTVTVTVPLRLEEHATQ